MSIRYTILISISYLKNRSENRIWKDLPWTALVFNFCTTGNGCGIHLDPFDIPGCSAVCALSNYIGGEFVNVTLKQKTKLEAGQVQFIDSHNHFHGFKTVIGKRLSLVLYTENYYQ